MGAELGIGDVASVVSALGIVPLTAAAIASWYKQRERHNRLRDAVQHHAAWAVDQISGIKVDHAELHDKHHDLRDQVQEHEVRFAAHGIHAGSAIAGRRMSGAPRRTVRDPTPPPVSIRDHEDSGPGDTR